jgi:hypothetical protein
MVPSYGSVVKIKPRPPAGGAEVLTDGLRYSRKHPVFRRKTAGNGSTARPAQRKAPPERAEVQTKEKFMLRADARNGTLRPD